MLSNSNEFNLWMNKIDATELAQQPSHKAKPDKNKTHHILEIITSSVSESTTHGIDHIFKRKNRLIKFFWLVCFLVSAATCSYMIFLSIIAFFQHETVTKAQQVNQISTDYPVVSICNINPYTTNFSFQYIQELLIESNITNPITPDLVFNYLFANSLLSFMYFVGTNALSFNRTDEFRKNLGYDIKDMLLSCSYNSKYCTADDFQWYFDPFYGNCFKFNSGIFIYFLDLSMLFFLC